MKTMLSFHLIFINNVLFIEIKPISRKRKRIATFLSFFLSFFIPRIEHSPIDTQPLFSILILPLKILRLLKIRVTMKAGYGTTTKGNRNSYTNGYAGGIKNVWAIEEGWNYNSSLGGNLISGSLCRIRMTSLCETDRRRGNEKFQTRFAPQLGRPPPYPRLEFIIPIPEQTSP